MAHQQDESLTRARTRSMTENQALVAPAPDRLVAAVVRPALASRRRGGRDRRHSARRAEEPRLCRHRRSAARERAVRGGGRCDHLRALLHVAADLDGAELVTRRGSRRRGAGDQARRSGRGTARRGDHPGHGRPVPAAGAVSDGVDRAVPVEGGDHRVPRRCRDRRDDRRASEADRNVVERRQRVAGARDLDPGPWRDRTGRRSSWGSCRSA